MASLWNKIGSSLADGIEKHTVGVMGMFSSIAFIAYLLFREGGSGTVESLVTTLMIVSAALMGITSISGAISNNRDLKDDKCTDKKGVNMDTGSSGNNYGDSRGR